MAFRFTLESLLRLRSSEQRQQELLLQKANEQVNRMVHEVEAIESEAWQIASTSKSSVRSTGAEIIFDASRHQVLDARRLHAEQQLQSARQQHEIVSEEFRRVWQRREALETLRERERRLYAITESRLEQRRQDDLFLQRRRKR